MNNAKNLSEEQIGHIRSWAEQGDGLSEIQKHLADEFEMKFTYLETRFLLEDLKIELVPEPVEEPEESAESTVDESSPDPQMEGADSEADAGDGMLDPESSGDTPGSVAVTIDRVQRPGALVSGNANFGGGNTAAWWLDQMGRLSMDPGDSGFRPSESQMMAFQQELQQAIKQSGL